MLKLNEEMVGCFFEELLGALFYFIKYIKVLMVNNKEIMGEYTNSRIKNTVGWVIVVVLIVLTAILTLEPLISAFTKR